VVNKLELQNFLIEAAVRCGVPKDIAEYQTFVEKVIKQFGIGSARNNSSVPEPDTPYINLKNGTLFFDKEGHRFEVHSYKQFIRYCLHFGYDPTAIIKLWREHLDRSLPNPDKQLFLAKCLALPFYPGKIEKAPLLYSWFPDTGKSTTLDVYKAVIGRENFTTESLAALTKTDSQGDYARARLDGKLVNIASDIGAKVGDEGIAKMLISREEVSARRPYGEGFDIVNYARLMFAANELPPQFFTDPALNKRAAVIEFHHQVKKEDKDTGFAEKIIADELPGVLNWIIAGLDLLLQTGSLDPPPCCVEETEQIKREVDPVIGWVEERGYQCGKTAYITFKEAFADFVKFCKEKNRLALGDRKFTYRLRGMGYEVERLNGHIGTVIFYSKAEPAADPSVSLSVLADMLHNSGQHFPFSEILPYFDGDREMALAFLRDNEFDLRSSLEGEYIASTREKKQTYTRWNDTRGKNCMD
jgi:putative DNA primase/helicase